MSTVAVADLHDTHVRLPGGSPQAQRRYNRGMVLRALQNEMTASRADLARLTGLARPTVSEVVKALIGDGIIVETGMSTESRPGKPAVMLSIDHDATQVIAIDVSDRALVRAALCAPNGRIVQRAERARPESLTDAVVEVTRELTVAANRPLLGVGIGIPVESWSGSDVESGRELIAQLRLELRPLVSAVHITNVADLAALAEHRHGPRQDEFLLLRLGARASTALHLGSAGGAHSTARELAHICVDVGADTGPTCTCGRRGCIHSWVTPAALAQRIAAASGTGQDERQIRRTAARHLGAALATIVSALDLHRIVVSGPKSCVDDELCATTAEAVRSAAALPADAVFTVDVSAVGDDDVLRGAAAHVVGAELGFR